MYIVRDTKSHGYLSLRSGEASDMLEGSNNLPELTKLQLYTRVVTQHGGWNLDDVTPSSSRMTHTLDERCVEV